MDGWCSGARRTESSRMISLYSGVFAVCSRGRFSLCSRRGSQCAVGASCSAQLGSASETRRSTGGAMRGEVICKRTCTRQRQADNVAADAACKTEIEQETLPTRALKVSEKGARLASAPPPDRLLCITSTVLLWPESDVGWCGASRAAADMLVLVPIWRLRRDMRVCASPPAYSPAHLFSCSAAAIKSTSCQSSSPRPGCPPSCPEPS